MLTNLLKKVFFIDGEDSLVPVAGGIVLADALTSGADAAKKGEKITSNFAAVIERLGES